MICEHCGRPEGHYAFCPLRRNKRGKKMKKKKKNKPEEMLSGEFKRDYHAPMVPEKPKAEKVKDGVDKLPWLTDSVIAFFCILVMFGVFYFGVEGYKRVIESENKINESILLDQKEVHFSTANSSETISEEQTFVGDGSALGALIECRPAHWDGPAVYNSVRHHHREFSIDWGFEICRWSDGRVTWK